MAPCPKTFRFSFLKTKQDKTKTDLSASLQILLAVIWHIGISKTYLCRAQFNIGLIASQEVLINKLNSEPFRGTIWGTLEGIAVNPFPYPQSNPYTNKAKFDK